MGRYADVRSGALLEREHEVERARGPRCAPRAGARASALVIEGAAGIGKSRLLETGPRAGVRARLPGPRCARDRARAGLPVRGGAPAVRAPAERGRARTSASAGWPAPPALAAEVLTGAGCAAADAARGPPRATPATPGSTACTGWRRTCRPMRRSALVVDDLQWCDAPSRGRCCSSRGASRASRWRSSLATRPLGAVARPGRGGAARRPRRRVSLRPVAAERERRSPSWSRRGCSSEPDDRFVRACLEVTGGNPFYVGELLGEIAASRAGSDGRRSPRTSARSSRAAWRTRCCSVSRASTRRPARSPVR